MLPDSQNLMRVYEPEGSRLLAEGHGTRKGQQESIEFSCDTGSGALLAYYFGKGRRQVVVQAGPNEGVSAHLKTRWANGHREWTLDW